MARRFAFVSSFLVVSVSGRSGSAEPRRELTFADAVNVALAHNGDLYVARAEVDVARDDIAIAASVFDSHLLGNLRLLREDQGGSSFRFAWTDTAANASLEYQGHAKTGLDYSLQVGALTDRYANPFTTIYNPVYTTNLTLSIQQPLMRGSGRAVNLAPIVVAARRVDVTEQELRARLEAVVGAVEVAYWTLALAYKEQEAREASLKTAQDQQAESERLLKLGNISELDVIEAKAGVERNKQDLLAARQQVTDAEGKLRAVIIGAPDWKPDEVLVPVESPDAPEPSLSVDEHVQLARKNRPDVATANAEVRAEQAGLAVTQNDLSPQLDLVASAGLIGFAGDLVRNYATSPILDNMLTPPYSPKARYDGGAPTAMKNLFAGGNYVVSVGLKLDLPIHNDEAKARHAKQQHEVARAKEEEQAILAQVENDVRTSIALLGDAAALRKAADDAVAVHQQLMAGMRKRFTAGAVTSFDVLRVADELARSQIAAARARVSYRISLARLARADGTLLEQLKITTRSLNSHR